MPPGGAPEPEATDDWRHAWFDQTQEENGGWK